MVKRADCAQSQQSGSRASPFLKDIILEMSKEKECSVEDNLSKLKERGVGRILDDAGSGQKRKLH